MRNLVALPALTAILFALLEQQSSVNALNSLARTTKQCRAPNSSSNSSSNSNTRLSVATVEPEVSSLKASATDNDNIDVDGVEFPPPLSSMDRTKRAATFYSTIVPIIANYAGLIANLKVQELMGTERFTEAEIEVCDVHFKNYSYARQIREYYRKNRWCVFCSIQENLRNEAPFGERMNPRPECD